MTHTSNKNRGLVGLSCMLLAMTVSSGCDNQITWEATYENRSDVPCSIFINVDNGRQLDSIQKVGGVRDVGMCERTRMIESQWFTGFTPIITVIRDDKREVFTPNIEIATGKRIDIVIEEDGQVVISASEREDYFGILGIVLACTGLLILVVILIYPRKGENALDKAEIDEVDGGP